MALGQAGHIAISMALVGSIAFILGVIAENKKPSAGEIITLKDAVICKFPNDPTVALGSLSFVFLLFSTACGLAAVFFPYKGKSIPAEGLFRSTSLAVFFAIATLVSVLAGILMLWATTSESLHIKHKFHKDLNYACPTAKTGLFGGAAFLALDSTLLWLVCQMLTLNSRADYEEEEDSSGDYGQVLTTDLPIETGHQFPKA
ncbi:uncharacterized protein LOC116266761 [Nymphaea colorata]|nr:uncharacterized protein LOC116266761 [Nymphaea colorata]